MTRRILPHGSGNIMRHVHNVRVVSRKSSEYQLGAFRFRGLFGFKSGGKWYLWI